jgi:hypothetical protein
MSNVPRTDDGNPTLGQILSSIHELRHDVTSKESKPSQRQTSVKRVGGSTPGWASSSSIIVASPSPSPSVPSTRQGTGIQTSMAKTLFTANDALGDGFVQPCSRKRLGDKQKTNSVKMIPEVRKQRNTSKVVIGRKVNEGTVSCRGADLTLNKHIGNVDNSVESDTIVDCIKAKGVDVIKFEELERKHTRFKSFRLCLKKDHWKLIEDPDFRPEGVIMRHFFRGKKAISTTDSSNGATAVTSQQNSIIN